jgi:hypothetical protein
VRGAFARGVGVCLTGERKAIATFAASFFGPDFRSGTRCRSSARQPCAHVAGQAARGGDRLRQRRFLQCGRLLDATLIDAQTGTVIADLEAFAVTRDKKPFSRSTSTTGG